MTKKRLLLLSVSITFIIATFLSWEPLASRLILSMANRYCVNHFGAPLQTQGIHRENGFWVVDCPTLIREDVSLDADKLLVKFSLQPFTGDAALEIAVYNSRIQIPNETADLEMVVENIIPQSVPLWFLSLSSRFDIYNGEVSWKNVERGTEKAFFQLHAEAVGEKKLADLDLYLGEITDHRNHFHFHVNREIGQPLQSGLSFDHVECGKIIRALEAFGHSSRGWQITGGAIDGRIELFFPEDASPYTIGKAVLSNVAFEHPQTQFSGSLGEALLDLQAEKNSKKFPSLIGRLEIVKDAALAFKKAGNTFWKVSDLKGGIYFHPQRSITMKLKGGCKHHQKFFDLLVDGHAQVVASKETSLDLSVKLISADQSQAAATFSAKKMGPHKHEAHVGLINVGPEEIRFVQEAFTRYAPQWKELTIHDGYLDAYGVASMEGLRLSALSIEEIKTRGMHVDFMPWDMSVRVGKTDGKFSINLFENNPLKTLNAKISVWNADLMAIHSGGIPLSFHDIQTSLVVKEGVLQKSEMTGVFAGLQGTIMVDWRLKKEAFHLSFKGPLRNIAPFVPLSMRHSILGTFANEELLMNAGVALVDEGLRVKGSLQVFKEGSERQKEISFGFDLEKSSEKLWKKWPADDLALSYWQQAGKEVLQTILPPSAAPAVLFESNWIQNEIGIAGMVLRKGWFQCASLPLQTYISPFLFPKGQMQLSGTGSFRGYFNHKRLAVEYDAEDVVLENSFAAIIAGRISGNKTPYRAPAVHYFDLETGRHFGSLPLFNAVYKEKYSGLDFVKTEACVTLEGPHVYFSHLKTQCGGVDLSGEVSIDFGLPDDGIFDVAIHTESIKGKVSQALALLRTFNADPFFLHIPAEGQISLAEEGANLHFAFSPQDFRFEADVKGAISNASMESSLFKMENAVFQFAYNHEKGFLEFNNIHAQLLSLGASTGSYQLVGDHIRFDDFRKKRASFDFWVSDKTRDQIRFVGAASALPGNADLIDVKLNQELSHIGNVHPADFQLHLRNWLDVADFRLALNLDMPSFKDFCLSGVGLWPEKIAKEIKAIDKAEGEARIEVRYDDQTKSLAYHLSGDRLIFGPYLCQSLYLDGAKQGDLFTIRSLKVDNKKLAGQFTKNKGGWDVKGLTFENGNILNVTLDGTILDRESSLSARVRHITIDLAELRGSPEIEQCMVSCRPHGKLVGNGEMKFDWGKGGSGWRVDAILDTALTNWDMKGIHFQDVKNVSFHFISDQGLTVRNLEASMIDPIAKNAFAHIKIEKMDAEFASGEVIFDDLKFQVPAHQLPRFTDQMTHSFPALFTPAIGEVVRNCKLEGKLEGVVQYELSPPYAAMKMTLQDGRYHFLNSEHDLSQCTMEYDPFELKVVSKYLLGEKNVWLYSRSSSPTLTHGELVITDSSPEQLSRPLGEESLYVNWEHNAEAGLSILKAEGSYQGISIDLERDPGLAPSQEAIHLVGTVAINAAKAHRFFPEVMAHKILEWRAGDGYFLRGKWRLRKSAAEDYSQKLHFTGLLQGDRFQLRGYQFDSLYAHLDYTPAAIKVKELKGQDVSGELNVEKIDFFQAENGQWVFIMPTLKVSKFRPCLLQEVGMPTPQVSKPLIIQSLVLSGCQGSLSDTQSIVGQGTLNFTNRSKKLLQNTIFHIPADILSRIGLDLSVLTPVSGTITYQIRDGKVFLTKLKDVYSEGKISKFNLLQASNAPSYMDFDGRLNVQVRMRQHNLLFKLAELFTVRIQGTLAHPLYALNKQRKENSR